MKRKLIALFLCAALLAAGFLIPAGAANIAIETISSDKARYAPGEQVTVTATLANGSGNAWQGTAQLEVFRLERPVYQDSREVTVPAGGQEEISFAFPAFEPDYTGYLAKISVDGSSATAGIDVSSAFTRYPRYGYVATYSQSETPAQSLAKMSELTRDFNINAFQFYDWMWRHDKLLKRSGDVIESTWIDLFDRTLSWTTIRGQIDAARSGNAVSMAYVQSYLARENYEAFGVSPAWGLYDKNKRQHAIDSWIDRGVRLPYFNPADRGWQAHMINEYRDALAFFDGLQIDQIGQQPPLYDSAGKAVDLEQGFLSFVNAAKTAIPGKAMTFNVVDGAAGGFCQETIARGAQVDFHFSELWGGAADYGGIRALCEAHRRQSGGKALVLAAYMNYDENIPRFDTPAVRLTNAAIAACGAFHIEMGAENGGAVMLGNEYYPNTSKTMGPDLRAAMRDHYNFITAYENILFDTGLAQRRVEIAGTKVSETGEAGAVWSAVRGGPGMQVVHLLNLTGETDSNWRNSAPAPRPLENLAVKAYLPFGARATGAYLASPEREGGQAQALAFTTGCDMRGSYVQCAVPSLEYWDVLWFTTESALERWSNNLPPWMGWAKTLPAWLQWAVIALLFGWIWFFEF